MSTYQVDMVIDIVTEAAMRSLGARFAKACGRGIVYMEGGLGSGKTFLSRAIIQNHGYLGLVKSPTYTLVEPYELGDMSIYHFDLYRLEKVEELLYLGVDDYFDADNLCLIEWPEKGVGFLPSFDIKIRIRVHKGGRTVELFSGSSHGEHVLDSLNKAL